LEQKQERGIAIGHFNVANLALLKAVFTATKALKVPSWWAQHGGSRPASGLACWVWPSWHPCLGVPLGMSRIRPEYLNANSLSSDRLVAVEVLLRQEPDEEEDEEEDEGDDDDDDNRDDDGYSE
jgi:hypothetical protein